MAVITSTCILHNIAIMFNEETINLDPEDTMNFELLIHSKIYLQLLSFRVNYYYFHSQYALIYTLISVANNINVNNNR